MTPEKREQVRKDLIVMREAGMNIKKNAFISKQLQEFLDSTMRTIETLAIEVGAFDESGADNG